MFEKGIREGLCQISHWFAKASNRYIENYDPNIIYILYNIFYEDYNNFYGAAMCKSPKMANLNG